MFETAEVGSQIPKEEYEAQVPQSRVDLINAQYDLRNADFPTLVLIAGDDRQGCNDIVNLLHEWMDARYLDTHVFGSFTDEEQLVEHGMLVLKFCDPSSQLRRFKEREKTPYKKYKITGDDYRNREQWDAYVTAVNEMVARTSTEIAPWRIVAADDKRWARVEVLKAVCQGLKRLVKSA